ncbi:MAG: hypothetical protein M1368_03670 [Thaumarchaeota archaeon]|nr:hypothetical protein [Nitrososphaerota archaeon]
MELRTRKTKIGLAILAAILISGIAGIGVAQASSTASVKTYHANPLIGSYPFVEDARGFMASNGYAYSYVLFNARVAQVGGTFTMLPALTK